MGKFYRPVIWLNVIKGIFVLLSAFGLMGIAMTALDMSIYEVFTWDVPFMIFLVGCITASSIPAIIGGIYLLKGRTWARRLLIVSAFWDALYIPIGTILGVFTLVILFDREAVEYIYASVDAGRSSDGRRSLMER